MLGRTKGKPAYIKDVGNVCANPVPWAPGGRDRQKVHWTAH